MKQIIIGQNKVYATTAAKYSDLTTVPEGTIGLYLPKDGKLITSKADLTSNFAIVCGRGEGKMPIHFPEVDVKTLAVTKAKYEEGAKFKASIVIPTTEKGKQYTVIVSKVGTVFNERANWTFNTIAKDTVAANVAEELEKQINANSLNLGVTATHSGGTLTIEAVAEGPNYNVLGADELMGVKATVDKIGKVAILDKAYVQDMASRCAAGKGFNDVYADGTSIYPGYPEVVEDTEYVMYSLRFAVPRVAAKQRDEVVYQTVHIVLPAEAGAISTLDSIFNTSDAISSASEGGLDKPIVNVPNA